MQLVINTPGTFITQKGVCFRHLKSMQKVGTLSPQLQVAPETLIQRLSYSHLELIVDLDDVFKQVFYEIECIRGNWA
ncbi:MAG: hypothetical protein WB792_03830 [Desulfobacterales bacterium]